MPNDPSRLSDTELNVYVTGPYGTGLAAAMTALGWYTTFTLHKMGP